MLVFSSLGLSCLGHSVLPGLGWLFPFPVRDIFNYHLFIDFHGFFLSPPPSGTCIMQMLVRLMLSQRSLRLSSSSFFFLILFFYILFCGSYFNHLSSRSHICSSASVILLLIPSSVLFISVCLFFSSSGSLVNISCIFSIPFQDPGSSSLSMFWILFLEDCLCLLHLVFFFLFFFLGFYLVPLSGT